MEEATSLAASSVRERTAPSLSWVLEDRVLLVIELCFLQPRQLLTTDSGSEIQEHSESWRGQEGHKTVTTLADILQVWLLQMKQGIY